MLASQTITEIRGNRASLVINLVSHSLYILSLPVWYFVAMFSVMLFDAPGSEHYWPALVLYYALKGYPYITLAMIALAWILFAKKRYRWTYVLNAVPIVFMILGTLPFVILSE
ncbi:hypothetical protein D3C76_241680 [compost metagenome]|nr:hypothetical protein [Paenibacillus timonensis]MUG88803.1 hypothetical protein [Paenibacillus timonensis]